MQISHVVTNQLKYFRHSCNFKMFLFSLCVHQLLFPGSKGRHPHQAKWEVKVISYDR